MVDDANQPSSVRPMVITITDKGKVLQVSDVQLWIDEHKTLLRRAREIMTAYDGTPASLYKQHGTLVAIATRVAEIKQIFDTFRRERNRHGDANITALVKYFSDPKNMEGVDD
jgi:hypothetical protein